jgi:6-phosphogluconolactonase
MPDTISLAAPDGSLAEAIVYADLSTLIAGAADFVAEEAAEAIAARGSFSIALSGGNTPRPVYQRLASTALDWARVHVFFGDERCVPPGDARSNYHMARGALIDHAPIPAENVHRMRGEDPPEAAAEAYAVELRSALGTGGRLDLVLLGLGHDGHTASLFPGLAAVTETERAAMAAYVEFVGMWRLTLTPPTINAARRVAFLVSGDDKAEVLHRVLQGPRQPVVLPAQAIRPSERPPLWLIDAAAAAKVDRPSARYQDADHARRGTKP